MTRKATKRQKPKTDEPTKMVMRCTFDGANDVFEIEGGHVADH